MSHIDIFGNGQLWHVIQQVAVNGETRFVILGQFIPIVLLNRITVNPAIAQHSIK
jgi:hypothetical protein